MTFDAEKMLSTTVTGPMSTAPVLCPEGEFKAFVDDGDKTISFTEIVSKKEATRGQSYPQVQVLFAIADEAIKLALKREKVLVPMKAFLDVRDDGTLDLEEGKNVALGRLRRALGQNDGAWSPLMMKGKGPVMVRVTHRSDGNDPSIKYAEVSRVSALGS